MTAWATRAARPRGIRAVLFDLDDTLFAHRGAVEQGLLAHVRALGHPYDLTDAGTETRAWRDLEELHYHRYLAGEVDFQEQRRHRARDYAARHGVTLDRADAGAWWSSYFEQYVANWRLHEDAVPCLDELATGIPDVRFGIITNGELAFQLHKIDAVRVRDRFDAIVASGEVGFAKPDARIFRLACERLGVTPAGAAYVGDRLGTDALGAAAAGLTGVWLDRYDGPVADDEREAAERLGVVRITGLAQLAAVLGG